MAQAPRRQDHRNRARDRLGSGRKLAGGHQAPGPAPRIVGGIVPGICLAAVAAVLAVAATPATAASTATGDDESVLRLTLGDPARRDRQVTLAVDAIADTRRGDQIGPGALADRLADVRLLFIGEDHTSMDFHQVQLAVVKALHGAGRTVIVALEMFPWSHQDVLDRWTAGEFSDEAFLETSGWYETWGYRWEYYRDIFHFARDKGLKMVPVNAPRDLVKRVRLEGLPALRASLPAADRVHLPPAVDTDSAEHRQLFRAYMGMGADDHGGSSLDGLFTAQCTWDAVMGWNALRALQAAPTGPGKGDPIVVVLIGSGHATYGLGAPRQLAGQLPDGALASLVPVPLAADAGTRGNSSQPATAPFRVQASYADFIWGLPPAGPTVYPELGVSLAGPPAPETNRIIQVTPGSPADLAGLKPGDRVEKIGSRVVNAAADLRRGMAGTRWGDSVTLTVAAAGGGPARDLDIALTLPGEQNRNEDAERGRKPDHGHTRHP